MSQVLNILKQKSIREIIFRVNRIVGKRLGVLDKSFPVIAPKIELPTLEDFRRKDFKYFFEDRSRISFQKNKSDEIERIANRILSGEILFFSKEWIHLGKNYDWVTNPVTHFTYDKNTHWSAVETLDKYAGDIKYVWEKSRFSYLFHIIRYDYHFDLDHSKFVFDEILSWIYANPTNCGPNFVCSQEISLRINNWLFALFFYRFSPNLTPEIWNKIIKSIYWQISHVYSNINFSRIAVRNNHAITETLTLYLFGLLFPEFPHSYKWKKKGKQWFEQEINYQFENDGTYLQNSMNYQRVVTQLLTWGISLAHLNGEQFSRVVYDKAYHSLNFLYQCMEKTTGQLPNYGNNDGALFFPLSSSDYRDFRPQLDALHFILTGSPLGENILEEARWLAHPFLNYPRLIQKDGLLCFNESGYFLFREDDELTFIRCGNFKKKGAPDQLHLDIWYKGRNIIFDGGTYRYNASADEIRYFRGTESHNTIMIGNNDQMLKGPRFMWFNPAKIKKVEVVETCDSFLFFASVEMFRHVGRSIIVHRKIIKPKGLSEWRVEDSVENLPINIPRRQLWHVDSSSNVNFTSSGIRIETEKAYSEYYGVKEPCKQVEFQSTDSKISTIIRL